MGNRISKRNLTNNKNNKDTCNFHEVFTPHEISTENKVIFDEKEHLSHVLYRDIFEGNYSSPIQNIIINSNAKILDVGCGSGFWLMEMASSYPKPLFYGIERLPLFPTSTHPSNVKFLRGDFLQGLPFEDNTFDFIHMQLLVCDFTISQWENFVYQELSRVLKPGGWLEICDPEFNFYNCGPTSAQINLAVCKSLRSKNVDPLIVKRHGLLIESNPLFSSRTLHHERRRFPIGSNATKLEKAAMYQTIEACKSLLEGPIQKDLNIKKKNIDSILGELKREFVTNKSYYYIHRFYVQKISC